MYKSHCLDLIAPAMRGDVEIFRRGAMFAICSIRQPIVNVPDQIGVLFDGEEGENPLFGHKFDAFDAIMGPLGAQLWAELRPILGRTRSECEWAIRRLLEVPGLGIVKAAFIAQLMGYDVACLDARNVAREGRNPRAYRTDGKTPRQLEPKIRAYVGETFGKAEHYWDAWCADVAAAYGQMPEQISELHLAILPRGYVPF